MSRVADIIFNIEQQKIGETSRRALIVEGNSDVHAIESFLTKKFPDWTRSWVVADAGKKADVAGVLAQKPDWCGVIDPDEWSEEIVERIQKEIANLWVLPRYCLENYLILPNELWDAFPQKQQDKVAGGLHDLETRITDDLDKWVCHGVLWSVINPLWEGLRARGFKEALLDPEIAQEDQEILETLTEWHDYLEPKKLFQQYQTKLAEVQPLSTEKKLQRWVHGKKFYNSVVNVVLNDLLGTKAANERQKAIFRTCQAPQDFDALWQKMELSMEIDA